MQRTRLHYPEAARRALLGAVLAMSLAAVAGERPRLQCQWKLAGPVAGTGPVVTAFTLTNRGPATVHVLEWATPFEGWLSPYLEVLYQGQALAYGGAAVKRGDPARVEYLALGPGRRRSVKIDLAQAFDLSRPGTYELRPRLALHDAYSGPPQPPRPRSQHQPLPLECPGLAFTRP